MLNDDSGISIDDQWPANHSDNLQSQHSRSGPIVLDPVDNGGNGDVTRPVFSDHAVTIVNYYVAYV